MSNPQAPDIKPESSSKPISPRDRPSPSPSTSSLSPTRTSTVQRYIPTHANPRHTDEPNGLTVTAPRLTPQELAAFYRPWDGTHYTPGLSDSGNNKDRDSLQDRRVAVSRVPNAPPYVKNPPNTCYVAEQT